MRWNRRCPPFAASHPENLAGCEFPPFMEVSINGTGPKKDGLQWEIELDDFGVPLFQETTNYRY